MDNLLANFLEATFNSEVIHPVYLWIGALYLVIASGTRRLHCWAIRKEIHHHEKLLEALIGAAYITYAVEWNTIWMQALVYVA